MNKEDLLKCRKCGEELAYLGSGDWGCDNCDYETNYDIVYFYNLGLKKAKEKDCTNRCVICYKKLPKDHPPMQSRCNKCDGEDF